MSDNVILLVKDNLSDKVLFLQALKKKKHPVDFSQFIGAMKQAGLYRLVLNAVSVMRRERWV